MDIKFHIPIMHLIPQCKDWFQKLLWGLAANKADGIANL